MAKEPVILSDPISIRLPVELLADLDLIAEACERPRSWIIVRALKQYRAVERADVLAIKEGMNQVARGEVHVMDDVLREMDAIIAADKAA
jgi:predicted transcriptional regulator